MANKNDPEVKNNDREFDLSNCLKHIIYIIYYYYNKLINNNES